MSEIEETAKATQEVAKTVSNALDKAEKAGTFMTKYFDEPLTVLSGIWKDKLAYRRWENQVSFWTKANKKLKDLGLDNPQKELPLKLGLPLLEAVSLEEDNKLQELWANLLVNATTNFSLERSYISVLEQLSLLEAEILIKIYSNFQYERNSIYVYVIDTTHLPKLIKITKYIQDKEEILINTIEEESNTIMKSDTHLALLNLARLQCIEGTRSTFGRSIFYTRVIPTLFGAKLYEAVKEPKK